MTNENVVSIERKASGRGGARPNSGRKIGSLTNPNAAGRFLYVLHEVDEPTACKIGIANDPFKRLSMHQISNWRPLKLGAVFTAETNFAAAAVEKLTHQYLSALHISGEWFRIPPERAVAELLGASERSGLPLLAFDIKRDLPNSTLRGNRIV